MAAKSKPLRTANDNAGSRPIAPWPIIDRYPTVIGSNLTLQYLSAVYRNATTGYRREYVDVLSELIERDPFAYAVVAQRVHAVAGGKRDVIPALTRPDSGEEDLAKEIADHVAYQIDTVSGLVPALTLLQWGGLYYGAGGLESFFDRDATGWRLRDLGFIHSRRLAWPTYDDWEVRIWDQGNVGSTQTAGTYPSEQFFGFKPSDFPGKFVIHTPPVRGDYPTRDGLGRELAWWMAIKGMAIRGGATYIERFAKPWAFAYYSTGSEGKPRTANEADILAGDSALKALGLGALASATLPDSIKIVLDGPAAKSTAGGDLPQVLFIEFIDRQVATAVLGNSDLTSVGKNGARASTETRKDGTRELYRFDGECLGHTLKRDVAWHIVHLNYPGKEHLTPTIRIEPNERPDPKERVAVIKDFASVCADVDADVAAGELGITLVTNEEKNEKGEPMPRRLAPLKPVTPFEFEAGEATAPPQKTPPALPQDQPSEDQQEPSTAPGAEPAEE